MNSHAFLSSPRGRCCTRVTEKSMPFRDRADAGRQLAARLNVYAGRKDVTIVALPRGGVPVGLEVAKILQAPLDVLIARRIVVPSDYNVTIGAVASGGVQVVDEELCRALVISEDAVRRLVAREAVEVERLESLYYGCHRAPDVRNRTLILVDDGMVTGASMRAAVTAVEQGRPAAIVVAVPIASHAACAELGRRVREFVYCYIRDPVYSVGLWYESYPPVSEQDVCRLLGKSLDPGGA